MKIIHDPQQEFSAPSVIAAEACPAAGFRRRLLGLMFRKTFGAIDAMYFEHCRAIHTFFMRFPIDVLCIDSRNTVIDMRHSLAPGKYFVPKRAPGVIIELPPGTLRRNSVSVGGHIIFEIS